MAQSKSIDFHVILAENTPQNLYTDEQRLKQILNNLIANALKFTPQGHVTLKIESQNEQNILFQVIDTGIGISPEHLPQLTQRFYRVDRARSRSTGGTGLGLAIVKRIASRHSGT